MRLGRGGGLVLIFSIRLAYHQFSSTSYTLSKLLRGMGIVSPPIRRRHVRIPLLTTGVLTGVSDLNYYMESLLGLLMDYLHLYPTSSMAHGYLDRPPF